MLPFLAVCQNKFYLIESFLILGRQSRKKSWFTTNGGMSDLIFMINKLCKIERFIFINKTLTWDKMLKMVQAIKSYNGKMAH